MPTGSGMPKRLGPIHDMEQFLAGTGDRRAAIAAGTITDLLG